MKKLLSVVAIIVFFASITVPVSSSNELIPVSIQVKDEKPKKKEGSKDSSTACDEKKAAACDEKKAVPCCEKKSVACADKDKK